MRLETGSRLSIRDDQRHEVQIAEYLEAAREGWFIGISAVPGSRFRQKIRAKYLTRILLRRAG
jgi:hypothetical protein